MEPWDQQQVSLGDGRVIRDDVEIAAFVKPIGLRSLRVAEGAIAGIQWGLVGHVGILCQPC